MVSTRTRTVVIGVVTTVWVVNIVAGIVSEMTGGSYRPQESINAIFGAIVGTLFAANAVNRRDEKNGISHKNKTGGDKHA